MQSALSRAVCSRELSCARDTLAIFFDGLPGKKKLEAVITYK